MNYHRAYQRLVESRKSSPTPSSRYEVHHIVPRALGGTNRKSNLVSLTPREHFVAHLLLARIHGGSMWAALAYMAKTNTKSAQGVRITSRTYDMIKREDAKWRSELYRGERNPFFGKTFTEEALAKMRGPRPSIAGDKHPRYGKTVEGLGDVISAVRSYSSARRYPVDTALRDTIDRRLNVYDHRASSGSMFRYRSPELVKLGQWYRGIELGEKARARGKRGAANPNYGNGQAISGDKNPMWGKEHSADTRAKIAEKAKRRIECPHCGKDGNIANMHRWHMDNCRLKT